MVDQIENIATLASVSNLTEITVSVAHFQVEDFTKEDVSFLSEFHQLLRETQACSLDLHSVAPLCK